MARRRDGGLGVGATTLRLVPSLIADRIFRWQAQTTCLACGAPFVIARGAPAAVLKAGNEIVGVICTRCLTPECAQRLTALGGVRGEDEAVMP